jgi:hypothetical protein
VKSKIAFKKCQRLDVQTPNDPIAIDPPHFVSTSMNFTHTLRPRDPHIGALRYGSNLTFLYTEKSLRNFDNIHVPYICYGICGRSPRSPLVGCYMAYSMLIRSCHEEGLNPRTNKAACLHVTIRCHQTCVGLAANALPADPSSPRHGKDMTLHNSQVISSIIL